MVDASLLSSRSVHRLPRLSVMEQEVVVEEESVWVLAVVSPARICQWFVVADVKATEASSDL